MPPQTSTALLLLVVFVLPGFVTVLLQERTFRNAEDPTPFDRLLRTLYYSVWCYLLLAVVALIAHVDRHSIEHLYNRYKSDPAELVWRATLAILVPPLVVATATRYWAGVSEAVWTSKPLRWLKINTRHEQPTGWDYFFRQRQNVYVRITDKNGNRVHGFYGSNSFAAYAKDGPDLYLERVYAPTEEGWFGEEATGNKGVWIKTDEAVSIEFYTPNYEREEPKRARSSEPPAEPPRGSGAEHGRPSSAGANHPAA